MKKEDQESKSLDSILSGLTADRDKYNGNFDDHLLELYKMHVEMANEVSKRRDQTNKFYVSLLSGILALFSLITLKIDLNYFEFIIILPILGIVLCIIWCIHISEYKKLNSAKFKVINRIEENLPVRGFITEWKILKNTDYKTLGNVEHYTPLMLIVLYIGLIIFIINKNYHILDIILNLIT